jgi:hypothetical protein
MAKIGHIPIVSSPITTSIWKQLAVFGGLLFALLQSPAVAQTLPSAIAADLDSYNVRWNVPGPTSAQSMPIGNGDIGLNVWVESNGDVGFYIGKSDALSENSWGSYGLLKVGGMHLSMTPSPLASGTTFQQVLKLRTGEIQVTEGPGTSAVTLRIWVDANHLVVRIEASGSQPRTFKVTLNNWRTATQDNGTISADTILSNQPNSIVWYHRDGPNGNQPLINLTFGALIVLGPTMVISDDFTLVEVSESLTNMNQSKETLQKLAVAVARNPQAASALKIGMFWESGGIATEFKNRNGYYPGWGDPSFVDYVMQYWLQPWFNNVPPSMLYMPVANRPIISFFASKPDFIVEEGRMCDFLMNVQSRLNQRYGYDPLYILPTDGDVDPMAMSQGWGQATWRNWDA